MDLKMLVCQKEKGAILVVVFRKKHWATDIESILMSPQKGRPLTFRRECIGGIECVVANILPCRSVELVGTRFGDSKDDTTGRPSIFRAEDVGKNSEFR